MANALSPMMPRPDQMAMPSSNLRTPEYLSPTAPAPAPAAPRAMPNALSAPNAYMGAPKKPQHEMLGAAVRGFQRGFDPAGFEKQREDAKTAGQDKAKKTLALMQQQRQLPEAQRSQWWQQNAGTIGQIIGQDISQQQVDPSQFTDQALDGHIAALSGELGISPATPEPMSAYQAEQIRLEEEKLRQPKKPIEINGRLVDPETFEELYVAPDKPQDPVKWETQADASGRVWQVNPYTGEKRETGITSRVPGTGDNNKVTWRPATQDDVATYNLPDVGYLISNNGDVKQITDSRKTGAVPASVQTMEQKYLDAQDAEAARMLDLTNKYSRFNELAKDWNSQGEGIFNDIGQAMSMETSSLKAITSELIGKMRTPGEGVMTDADAKRLENATVGINQTREGNQRAEQVVRAGAQRAQDRALFLRQWTADNGAGSLNRAKLAWNRYAATFPVYHPQTGMPNEGAPDAYNWAMQNGLGQSRATEAPPVDRSQMPRPTTKEERDALPPGTQYITPDGRIGTKR